MSRKEFKKTDYEKLSEAWDQFWNSIINDTNSLISRFIQWLTKLIQGKTPYKFDHNHNVIRSNVDKETLLATRNGFSDKNVLCIWVNYADGFTRHFDETSWTIHGNDILKNCAKIKVIVIYGKDKV